jgi:hypothetical protein
MAAAIALLSKINAVAKPYSWGMGQAQMTPYVYLLLNITEIIRLNCKAFLSTGKLELVYKEQPTRAYVHRCSLLGNRMIYEAITMRRHSVNYIHTTGTVNMRKISATVNIFTPQNLL